MGEVYKLCKVADASMCYAGILTSRGGEFDLGSEKRLEYLELFM